MPSQRLPAENRETLDSLAFQDNPEHLASALYGPAWREAVRQTATGWRTARDPLPTFLADFLGDILRDVVAHDGRSTRESRAGGWWVRSPSGVWSPTSVEGVAAMLHADLTNALSEALSEASRCRNLADRAPGYSPALTRASRDASLRAAVLSGLSHVVASLGRNFSGAFRLLRERSALTLPPEALRAIASTWLQDALALDDLRPVRGRLLTVDVKALHEDQTRSGAPVLPLLVLYRALDEVLGPRLRRVEWPLPDTDEAA